MNRDGTMPPFQHGAMPDHYRRLKAAGENCTATTARCMPDHCLSQPCSDLLPPQVLFKMLNRGIFKEINGCVSTGKEANVYHATPGPAGGTTDLAIKIYKTSILVFKDRDR